MSLTTLRQDRVEALDKRDRASADQRCEALRVGDEYVVCIPGPWNGLRQTAVDVSISALRLGLGLISMLSSNFEMSSGTEEPSFGCDFPCPPCQTVPKRDAAGVHR